ncbi:MAG: hypothetical protein U9Q04_09950 [Campylobacterota bacterium]|nr:hypothetical protein [Campylobacterota bacterium]
MIINISKVKTEALLLFARDLIESYKNQDKAIVELSSQTVLFIDTRVDELLKVINKTVQPIDYYIRNSRVSRISLILKSYEHINKSVSKQFGNNEQFNPSMLCFSLLSTWFAEFEQVKDDPEFIYFTIYPYSEIYDELLLNTESLEYKQLNIKMLNIAENTIYSLNNYKFR